jgi:hypothetical protein
MSRPFSGTGFADGFFGSETIPKYQGLPGNPSPCGKGKADNQFSAGLSREVAQNEPERGFFPLPGCHGRNPGRKKGVLISTPLLRAGFKPELVLR